LIPAMQQIGRQSFDAMILTSLDTLSAQYAAEVIRRYRPPLILTAPIESQQFGWTRAGAEIDRAISTLRLRQKSLTAGNAIDLGQNATLRILWPPSTSHANLAPLILLLEYQGRRILLLDPAVAFPLEPFACDAIILLGPRPSVIAPPLQKLITDSRAQTVIYSGRTPWAPRPPHNASDELNTADRALILTITSAGELVVTP